MVARPRERATKAERGVGSAAAQRRSSWSITARFGSAFAGRATVRPLVALVCMGRLTNAGASTA